jgi:osmotically-inducible protein OsmY
MLAAALQGCAPLVVGGAAATGVAVTHDRRTAGSVIDDQSIELKARSLLGSDAAIAEQAQYSVTSYNGVVLVTGEAPNEDLRNRITDSVRGIDKAKIVHNEMIIAAPSSLSARSSDTLLTGKVKTRLLSTENIDASRIKVVSEGGVVYLMGIVTRGEADVATEVARTTAGVQRVVKVFEYIEG